MNSELLLEFRPDLRNPKHADVLFHLGRYSCTCGSYFFALDRTLDEDCEDDGKIRRMMRALLEAWMAAVTSLDVHSTIYQPFDLSDEYAGCLRCTGRPDGLEITPGWSRIEGWRVTPGNSSDYFTGIKVFEQGQGWAQVWSVADFVGKIDEAIAELAVE